MVDMRYIHGIPINLYMVGLIIAVILCTAFGALAQGTFLDPAPPKNRSLTPQRLVCVSMAEGFITGEVDRALLDKINAQADCRYKIRHLEQMRADYEAAKKQSR